MFSYAAFHLPRKPDLQFTSQLNFQRYSYEVKKQDGDFRQSGSRACLAFQLRGGGEAPTF